MRWQPTEDEKTDVARLNAEPWQIELLSLNPEFTSWGPGENEDRDDGADDSHWNATLSYATWSKFAEAFEDAPDDLNEIVHFYFDILRESEDCADCDASGLAPHAKALEDAFYNDTRFHKHWCDKITLDEAQALVDHDRFFSMKVKPAVVDADFVERINQANRDGHRGLPSFFFNHDAINRFILIKARCKRLGFKAFCSTCDGQGDVFTAKAAHVRLVLWMLHPGNGAARFVIIERLKQTDRTPAMALLAKAAERNVARFARVDDRAEDGARVKRRQS